MTSRAVSPAAAAARTTAGLLAGAALVALGACDQRPEPHPTYAEAPPPPPAPLAGEPDAAPTMAPPAVEPPAAPSMAPPSDAPAPTQGLVAMAPIPNPEDGGPVPPARDWRREPAAGRGDEPAYRPHRHHHHWRAQTAPSPAPAAPRHAAAVPAVHAAAKTAPPHKAGAHSAAKPAPVAVPAKPAPVHEHRASKHDLSKAATSNTTAANATANGTGQSADARTEALRSALSAALAKGAVLSVPKPTAEGAADVTLTVPASFYDTLRTEAGKQAMSDSAASVNLDAMLSGDGWSIIPAGAQSQPLHAGQPTVFKWTVTAVKSATGANAGPLRADVNADLLGEGSQTLALGAVDPQAAGGGAFHWWGAALLAIVVLLGLGFLLRGSGVGAPANGRRRPVAGEVRRPFDMTNGNGDYRP